MKDLKINYDKTFSTKYGRDYSRGKSFHYCGEWVPGIHYVNDDLNRDFVVYDQVLLACKLNHTSTENNKPDDFILDERHNIIGIDSKYWDVVIAGVNAVTDYMWMNMTSELGNDDTRIMTQKGVTDQVNLLNASITATAAELRSEYNAQIENTASDIVTDYTSLISQTAQEINSTVTANRQAAEAADSALSSTISQTASAIRSEVASEVSTLNGQITSTNSTLTQTASDIRSEVSSAVSTLDGRIDSAESAIQQNADDIALRVTTATYNSNNQAVSQRIAAVELDAEGIHQSVSALENGLSGQGESLMGYIDSLQEQIDGAIDTWFYNGTPSANVLPESEWVTIDTENNNNNERLKHIGDLYYDNSTGYAYRYTNSGSTASPSFSWIVLSDSAVISALANAATAQATADSKMKVFTTQPVPPYQLGDLWVQGSKNDGSGTILKCIVARDVGATYVAADWAEASDFTKKSVIKSTFDVLADAIEGVVAEYDETGILPGSVYSRIQQRQDAITLEIGTAENNAISTAASDATAKANAAKSGAKSEISTALLNTGINITSGQITMTADNIIMQNNHGTKALSLSADSNGDPIISASNLDLSGVLSIGAWDTGSQSLLNTAASDATSKANAAQSAAEATAAADATSKANAAQAAAEATASADATSKANTAYNNAKDYADQTIQAAISGKADSSDYSYLRTALGEDTAIVGGLILSTLIQLGSGGGTNNWQVKAGISGEYDDTKPGNGIAAWFGGTMADKDDDSLSAAQKEAGAKTLFRMDGSGYLANKNISWDTSGNATFSGNITATSLTLGNNVSIAASKINGLSPVATSGSYSSLSNTPDLSVYALGSSLTALETQVDKKAETWYQSTNPSTSWETDAVRAKHVGDIWMDTSTNGGNKTYIYHDNGTGASPRYSWAEQNVPNLVFDTIDGKAAIYTTVPGSGVTVNTGDLLIPTADISGTSYKAGKVYKYTGSTWSEISYTDDSALTTFINGDYATALSGIGTRIDNKTDAYYGTKPYNDKTNVSESDSDDVHVGDIWYDSTNQKTYIYQKIDKGADKYDYKWSETSAVPQSVFDTIDGKSTIYVSKPGSYEVNDMWIIESSISSSDTPANCQSGDIVIATASSNSFNKAHWVKKVRYTDDSGLTSFITGTYASDLSGIRSQVDQKADTWYQSTDPSSSWTSEQKPSHAGDIWHNTSSSTVAGVPAGQDAIYSGSEWVVSDTIIPQSVFDEIDGKSSIYVSKPSSYNVKDMWIIESTIADADLPTNCVAGDIVVASNSSSSFNKAHWSKKVRYTDDSALTSWISNDLQTILNGIQGQIDGKVDTYYQSASPHSEYASTNTRHENWVGDLWCNSTTGATFIYTEESLGGGNYKYSWEPLASADTDLSEVFDALDGKSSIYISYPLAQGVTPSDGDLLILSTDYPASGTPTYLAGKCYRWTNNAWTALDYTDSTAVTTAANNARDAARNNLAAQLGYTDYNTMVTSVQNNGSIITSGGYLRADLIDVDNLITKQLVVTNKDSQNNDVVVAKVGDTSYPIWSGGATAGAATFKVSSAGDVTANSIDLGSGTVGGGATNGFSFGTSGSGNNIVSYLRKGMTSLSDTTNNGIYLGTDGIALGQGKFKVTADGTITATGLHISYSNVDNPPDLSNFLTATSSAFTAVKNKAEGKSTIWYTSTDPSTNWTPDEKTENIGDIWHNTSGSTVSSVPSGKDAIYNGSGWTLTEATIPQSLYDKIDGKASIYTSQPTSYKANDLWILAADTTVNGVSCKQGEVLVATTSSNSYVASHWIKKLSYTDNVDYLKSALADYNSVITGGLILSSFIGVKDTNNNVVAAINAMGSSSTMTDYYDSTRGHGRLMIAAGIPITSGTTPKNDATFRVFENGHVDASDLHISGGEILITGQSNETLFSASDQGVSVKGSITATSGSIGGITIESNQIKSSNNAFSVTNAGALTATSGSIGCLTIGTTNLSYTEGSRLSNEPSYKTVIDKTGFKQATYIPSGSGDGTHAIQGNYTYTVNLTQGALKLSETSSPGVSEWAIDDLSGSFTNCIDIRGTSLRRYNTFQETTTVYSNVWVQGNADNYIRIISQTDYNNLGTKDSNTLYFITGS